MYGFVNSALEKLIKRRFGVEKWNEIRTHAKLFLGDKDSFHVNHVYKDDDTYSVVKAASEVLGLDAATILEMFGEQFLLSCQESGYAKTLQLLGRTLQDFLTNLDALHDHLSIIYPQMDAPSFRCTAGVRKSEFLLHYYSDRDSLEHIVMGIVKSVAREYYHVELEMKVMVKKGGKSDHTIFSIREMGYHRANVIDKEDQDHEVKSYSDKNLISSATFCKAFPFHVVFDSNLTILQVGSSLSWGMTNLQLNKDNLASYFNLERPRMKLTFENILSHINTIFILRMSPVNATTSSSKQKHNSDRLSFSLASGTDPMRLRGQMVYAPESEAMLFICSPRVKQLHGLEQRGLYLSDIPIHDATRGMLMMSQAAAAEFTKSVQLEELIINLNSTQESLEEEKKRMSDLLHQMLPISVADNLMAGQMVEAERFESVTILFSDIVGFTSICSHSEPMEIVNMLNKLYSLFDQVVGQNQVYKVETIGDAYMVVGGLPERNTIHAECVANQALDMMLYCKQVQRPDNNEAITMRIGIHSGAVVAGVVGRRMPRYCLFGNTVNVASRTESNGTPGKIQVTQYTYNILKDNPSFKFEVRGFIEFKNVPEPVECYYLLHDNFEREMFTPLIVTDDTAEFQFSVLSRNPNTPPGTPHALESETRSLDGLLPRPGATSVCPFSGAVPDFNLIKPTPNSTPNPTPPGSQRNSLSSEYPNIITSSPTPPPCHTSNSRGSPSPDSDDTECSASLITSPPSILDTLPEEEGVVSIDHHHYHAPTNFMLTMRNTSMSPLKEDFSEDDMISTNVSLTNLDEGIEMQRKISDVSGYSADSGSETPGEAKHSARKISDVSTHSGESGIESTTRKISDTVGPEITVVVPEATKLASEERKLSSSSSGSTEEELSIIRRSRAGSVNKAIEKFDTLTQRIRKSGINMVCSTEISAHSEISAHDSFNGEHKETSVA